jgi:predicted TIM-barrel fold metal-dependent hydrolase
VCICEIRGQSSAPSAATPYSITPLLTMTSDDLQMATCTPFVSKMLKDGLNVRALEALAKNEPVVLARVIPFMVGVPLDDRIYYPVYAKCSELGLPISVNTGIPGPPAPARTQDPLLLDEVCLFFPELTVIMAHGADPWWNVAIRLMLKYRNLYLMTSAFAPKYFPQELITFMNTRGKEKILFASDHPVLSMERTVNEAREMTNLKPGVLEKFLYDNAWKVLFEKRFGPSTPQG